MALDPMSPGFGLCSHTAVNPTTRKNSPGCVHCANSSGSVTERRARGYPCSGPTRESGRCPATRGEVMFAVLFEVHPHTEQWDAYLDYAKMLRPELEAIDGFVDNIRYRSLTRPGWILSLSSWRDEKALVRWRTRARHHDVQAKGREEVLADYHLRVGQLTNDTHLPTGYRLDEQRFDVTEVGEGTTVTLSTPVIQNQERALEKSTADDVARVLGLNCAADGLVSWD